MESVNSTSSDDSVEPAPARPDAVALKQGDTVGSRFVIDERLRRAVVGGVYRAVDQKSGKKISILMMDPGVAGDKETTESLRTGVKSATELAHKNIVGTFGMGKEGRRRYIAREYVDGQTLAELLEKKATAGKHFTLKGAYNLIAHVCNGLQYARSRMTHGTLRPSAILINRTGRVKVSGFGLAELRPALEARRAEMSRWDAACLPDLSEVDEAPEVDDIYAVGVLLYSLLSGQPPSAAVPELPDAVRERLPEAMVSVLRRCVSVDPEQRFRDPNELKTELLQVVEAARGARPTEPIAPVPGKPDTGPIPAASIEVMADTPAPRPANRPSGSRRAGKRTARGKKPETGGFVIPELHAGGSVDHDDGTTARWLVERAGIDYGPYTRDDVVEQLRNEEIDAQTVLYDIESDRRLSLSEFTAFDAALVAWSHERAELEKTRAEQASINAAKRRTRMALTVFGTLALVVGGGVGGWFWYQSTLPEPVRAHLGTLVVSMNSGLPAVPLPDEELPETEAEKRDRLKSKRDGQRRAAAAADRRAQMEEARLAASSSLNVGSGNGAKFDRASFDRVVGKRYGKLTKCLQREAARNPKASKLDVKITIIPTGRLINAHMPNGTDAANRCVRGALRGLRVPPFDGTNHKVTLPFSIGG